MYKNIWILYFSFVIELGITIFALNISEDPRISYLMMSWSGLGHKIANSLKTQVTTTAISSTVYVKYLSRKTVDNGNKKEEVYGSFWEPEKNTQETQVLVRNLASAFESKDKPTIYCTWLISSVNLNGWFPQNNTQLINSMSRTYNSEFKQKDLRRVDEVDFLRYWNISYSNQSISSNSINPYLSLTETMAIEHIEHVNGLDLGFNLVRNNNNNLKIPNLGFQPNNDCIVVLNINNITGQPELCYIDIKRISFEQAMSKLEVTNLKGNQMYMIESSGKKFGCNIYVFAVSEEEDLVLNLIQKQQMLNYLNNLYLRYPNFYKGLLDSKEYKEFQETGDWNSLSASPYIVPRPICAKNLVPQEIVEKMKNSDEYKRLVAQMPESTNKDVCEKVGMILDKLEVNEDNN